MTYPPVFGVVESEKNTPGPEITDFEAIMSKFLPFYAILRVRGGFHVLGQKLGHLSEKIDLQHLTLGLGF